MINDQISPEDKRRNEALNRTGKNKEKTRSPKGLEPGAKK